MQGERLTYKKYNGCNDILEIDLKDGYSIIAIKGWDNSSHCYNVEFMLHEKSIDKLELIETIKFYATPANINSAILKQTSVFLHKGFFEYYIKRFEYEGRCFNIGEELVEFNVPDNCIPNCMPLVIYHY